MATALGNIGAKVVIIARKAGDLAAARAELEARAVEVQANANDISKLEGMPPPVDDGASCLVAGPRSTSLERISGDFRFVGRVSKAE